MNEQHRWRLLERRTLIAEPWFTLHADTCETPAGERIAPYYVLGGADSAIALACTPEAELVLVEQYRHAAGVLTWELPGGVIDAGENAQTAAQRELLEETGFAGRGARVLLAGAQAVHRFSTRTHLVALEHASPVKAPQRGPGEHTRVQLWPLADAKALLTHPMFADLGQKGLLAAGLAQLGRL
ncbi:MAG: NUDIX hydrolase [Hyphomonadaceae bacterium]|nr:NUDIX hydrolase [Hyphomonadaceae bacterium]